ncbi:MAG: hypothetical protein K5Q68_15065 [Roseococcus sp.]|nr:hypothetical protein [Roseococcus sp.]
MLRLQILLQAVDRLTAPMRAVEARLAAVGAAAQRIGRESGATRLAGAMRNVAAQAGVATGAMLRLTGTVAGVGAAGAAASGFAFNSQFLRPAAEAERMMITLRNQLGEEGANRAFAWVNDFAARTPYALAEVQSAFVSLNNLGINPMTGGLQAVGDAAAIMRTSYSEAVTAFSAAMRGEMDPMERFGVFGRTQNGMTTLRWRDRQGTERAANVREGNRDGMAAALQDALNSKFAGGMEELSRSWDGMVSNLGDAWMRFTGMVMKAGVFDWMKERLEELLARVNAMAEDGTLRAWAEQIAASILVAFNAIRAFLVGTDEEPAGITRLMDVLRRIGELVSPVTDHFGTMETALGAIGLVLAGPLIASLAGLTLGMTALGVALVATPAGWFAIAAAGIIALAAAITNNWGGLGDWFGQQLSGLLDPLGALERGLTSFRDWAASILSAWQPVAAFFDRLSAGITAVSDALGAGRAAQTGLDAAPPAIGNVQGRQRPANPASGFYGNDGFWNQVTGEGGAAPAPGSAAAPRPAASSPRPVQVQTGGQLNIRVEDGRPPQVTGRPANPDERWSINQGPRLVTP